MRRGAALLAGCLALAALSLLAPSAPSYDPFAWIVWGRELVTHEVFGLHGGPSWKPLPVAFTSVFALAGGAAPSLWLVVARAGALLAVVGAAGAGTRLGGRWAGAMAAGAVVLLAGVVSLAWRGASEPLMLACLLGAVERHVAGRRGSAFWLGVAAALIRPEAFAFVVLYAAWGWRAAVARERAVLAGGLLLVPLLWLGPQALAGDVFAANHAAANDAVRIHHHPAWTALRRGLGLAIAPVWLLALAAPLLRPRDRPVRVLALGATAWLAIFVVLAVAGYAAEGRYMLPAAAIACVLAGVAVVELARRWVALGVAALLVAAAFSVVRVGGLADQVREGVHVARVRDQLVAAIERAGGRAELRRCALDGWIAVNHTTKTTLAWELHVPLDRVAGRLRRPGLLVVARREPATGEPPTIALLRPLRRTPVARAGLWRITLVTPARMAPPVACRPRSADETPLSGVRSALLTQASALARRIPNVWSSSASIRAPPTPGTASSRVAAAA